MLWQRKSWKQRYLRVCEKLVRTEERVETLTELREFDQQKIRQLVDQIDTITNYLGPKAAELAVKLGNAIHEIDEVSDEISLVSSGYFKVGHEYPWEEEV